MKVLIIDGGASYVRMFQERGWDVVANFHKDKPDLVQFCGGEDIHPSLYGEEMHPKAHVNLSRDKSEQIYYQYCVKHRIPVAGICRGGQFLNVMNGGKMWQHVDGHAGIGMHQVADMETGQVLDVTSTHHQMMRPSDKATVIAVTNVARYKEYMDYKNVIVDVVPSRDFEVVYYAETQSLCFQPHPEFSNGNCQTYYFELLKRKLGLKV